MDKDFYILRDRFEQSRIATYNASKDFSKILFEIVQECGIAPKNSSMESSTFDYPLFRVTFRGELETTCIEFDYTVDNIDDLMYRLQHNEYKELSRRSVFE